VILGLAEPDEGEARIDGVPYGALRHPLREVGALLEATAFHPGRRARPPPLARGEERPAARARRRDARPRRPHPGRRRRVGGYSLGMRQRLGIAAAMLGDPPALMLDKPVNGLDPEGVTWIRGLLRALAAEGRAILVSSHLMSELQDTADHVVVIGRGRLIADAPVEELVAAVTSSPSRDCRRSRSPRPWSSTARGCAS
jgi:ABC-2 type transport system ATP-binding protein